MNKANFIVVGGTIAAGKSSLVEGLANAKGWNMVPELREGDRLQELVLEKLYEGKRLAPPVVQYYFLTNRFNQYRENSQGMITSILDRGIWEDLLFSRLLLANEKPELFKSYEKFWRGTINKLVKNFGKPKAYFYLKVDWETFKQRIYGRNRSVEVTNFAQNEEYFKNLLNAYINDFAKILSEWDIPIITIDAINNNKEEVLAKALEHLEEF